MVLLYAKSEVSGLKKALYEGKIDGSTYSGECSCLVGTIASVKGCTYYNIEGLKPDAGRPAERWFLGITPGNTPENDIRARITMEWILEFELLISK